VARNPLEFGVSIVPSLDALETGRAVVAAADEAGLDLVGIQDHPYAPKFVETFALIGDLLATTRQIRFFPDVANVPLRLPAMIGKTAATLDVLSGGRFELALGAGAQWERIAGMGGPSRTPGEGVSALEEAIAIIRLQWSGEPSISFDGEHYSLSEHRAGPRPAHDIAIWLGAYKPRMLRMTGRLADGWIPSFGYLPPAEYAEAAKVVDEAAEKAGRDPAQVRRVYNFSGQITDGSGGEGNLDGPVGQWVDTLSGWAADLRIDTFIFWPEGEDLPGQVGRFAAEVVPGVKDAAGAA
jgi:alkanesulfonate monooxygenase SsuD/methylene tetrahydromethanopterin reductase-like flavin-dependent oxidoreductase (luciferase family)